MKILLKGGAEFIGSSVIRQALGDGSQFGIDLQCVIQESPDGLAQASTIDEAFIGSRCVSLVLGDNAFYGKDFAEKLKAAVEKILGATIFGYHVAEPSSFGVAEFNAGGQVISIEEKPAKPKSNYAVTGLYFYANDVIEIAKSLKPSNRVELETSNVNTACLAKGNLSIELLGRGFAWLDTGKHDSIIDAGGFVQTLKHRQGIKIACLGKIARQKQWITKNQSSQRADGLKNSGYGIHLQKLAAES